MQKLHRVPYGRNRIPVAEALTWIASGSFVAEADWSARSPGRWRRLSIARYEDALQLQNILTALRGRTATQPYSAVYPVVLEGIGTGFWADRPLSPAGPRMLRHMRSSLRRTTNSLATFGELTEAVAAAAAEEFDDINSLRLAQTDFFDAVVDGQIAIEGRPALARDRPDYSAAFRQIDRREAQGPRMIYLSGWLRDNDAKPLDEVGIYRGPWFDQITVSKSDVLRLWPQKAEAVATLPVDQQVSSGSVRRGRPPKYDFASVKPIAMVWLRENGAPGKGDGHQAEFEMFIRTHLRSGEEASTSRVREIATEWIAEFRLSL